jgi:hypothetical protein
MTNTDADRRSSKRIALKKDDKENATPPCLPPSSSEAPSSEGRPLTTRRANRVAGPPKRKIRRTKSAPMAPSSPLPSHPLPAAAIPPPEEQQHSQLLIGGASAHAPPFSFTIVPREDQPPIEPEATLVAAAPPLPLPLEGNPTLARANASASGGQRLSTPELRAVAYAIIHKTSIGQIFTNDKQKVIVKPPLSDQAPTGEAVNHASAWAAFANSNEVFGEDTDGIREDTGNISNNDSEKLAKFLQFTTMIQNHANFHRLAELVDDPEGGRVLRMSLVLRGAQTSAKVDLLNALMIVWAREFKMKNKPGTQATYQPNYVEKCCQQLFKCLHNTGVMLNHADFKEMIGSYWAYFSKEFDKAKKERPTYGRLPMRASVVVHYIYLLQYYIHIPF